MTSAGDRKTPSSDMASLPGYLIDLVEARAGIEPTYTALQAAA
jgi:hypothetical protein